MVENYPLLYLKFSTMVFLHQKWMIFLFYVISFVLVPIAEIFIRLGYCLFVSGAFNANKKLAIDST